ncbi:MAG: monovalent cation/H(+) antiporter subunit G [Deltaproteobacteria bacterium]|jgi:multicomponent Na+:H+ antiporter subunit G|nr:monovalent cation/H(+) antiporter subunit G [Deltaproteobacteria bacterium]
MNWIGNIFIITGALFTLLGSLGVLRMPDVYNRLQAGTKATTLGFLSILVGAAFLQPLWIPKLILIGVFLVITAPISSHNLARASHRRGLKKVLGKNRVDQYASEKTKGGLK